MGRGSQECSDCYGTGVVVEENGKRCKNCNGSGSCAAGRGNRYVCNVCNGDGQLIERKEKECKTCHGSGTVGGSAPSRPARAASEPARQAAGPAVIGRGRDRQADVDDRPLPASRSGSRGRGRRDEDDDEDEETGGGSAPSRPATATKAKAHKPETERSTAGSAANATAELGMRCALSTFGIHGNGIHWREGEGLEIDLLLTIRCLLTTLGSIVSFVGMILMGRLGDTNILYWILGGVLLVLGSFINIYANYAKCLRCLQGTMVQGPRASS